MSNLILKRKARLLYSHFRECAFLLFCILGIVTTVPIHAQQKPKRAQMRSVSYSVPSEYIQVGNTMLYYHQTSSSIDVQGCYNGLYYGSTYSNRGYTAAIQVNNNSATSVDCLNGTTINGVSCTASIEPQGELARVFYTLTNITDTVATISLGVYGDVMIGDNDQAPIIRRTDTTGNTYGLTMMNGNGVQLCVLFGAGLAGITSVGDYWFGNYGYNSEANEIVGNYSSGDDFMVEDGSYDSAMGWCWKNRTISAGSTVVFSYLIGVGEVNLEPKSSFEVTPDDLEGWNDLTRPHKLTLEGTYESPAGIEGMIEYAVEDSEEWHQLTEMMPSGSRFNETLVAMFDILRKKHVIRFRTRDNVGNTTLQPSIEYLDVSFHEYSGINNKTYTGDSIYQKVECADIANLQITAEKSSNNVNVGTASFYIEGIFPYTIGRKACTFQIEPAPLTGEIELSTDSFIYNGQDHFPVWSFVNESYAALEDKKDYNVYYTDSKYPGTAKLCVVGKGNYTSELTKAFFIDKAPLSDDLVSITLPYKDISCDEKKHNAVASVNPGVGKVTFTYTLHGESDILEEAPTAEGHYDIYVEIANGDWYYGKTNEYVGSFSIYRFDELEWQSLALLFAELQQMGASLTWNIAEGVKNVGTFEELMIEEGHVVGISLANKGMKGTFPSSLMSFEKLEVINLSGNNLFGDVSAIIAAKKMQNETAFNSLRKLDISNNNYKGNIGLLGNCMSNLTSLNASYNKFEDLYPVLSTSVATLDISHQKMDRVVELNMSDLSLSDIGTKVPTILLYDQVNRIHNDSLNLLCTKSDLSSFNKYDSEVWAMQLKIADNQISIPYVSSQNAYHGESGDTLNVLNMTGDDETDGSSFRIALSFNQGDANFVNGVDATDLQTTILYAFGGYRTYPFNFTAADTFKDGNINVQDVVCTVNILLNPNDEQPINARSQQINKVGMKANTFTDTEAYMYMSDGKLFLHSQVPVASLSIKAEGDMKWNLDGAGLQQSTANGNVVAFSLNGSTIPSYEDVVLGECTQATVSSVSLSDIDAQPISVSFINNSTTNIRSSSETKADGIIIFDILGYKRNAIKNGINIIQSNGTIRKFYK
ncbi:MAG: hypothetical protein RR280_08390 [Bacteroidaceae bacterium]